MNKEDINQGVDVVACSLIEGVKSRRLVYVRGVKERWWREVVLLSL